MLGSHWVFVLASKAKRQQSNHMFNTNMLASLMHASHLLPRHADLAGVTYLEC